MFDLSGPDGQYCEGALCADKDAECVCVCVCTECDGCFILLSTWVTSFSLFFIIQYAWTTILSLCSSL